MAESRAYMQMLEAAKQRLRGKNPMEIGKNAGVDFDGEYWTVSTLGKSVKISCRGFSVCPELPQWHTLVLLHYMDLADGTPTTGELISFGQVKDGLVRGVKFDLSSEQEFQKILLGKREEQIREICKELGAEFVSGRGDLAVLLPFLPRYPLTWNIWLADDEFPATGKLLLDASADHYLTIEDAVTVGEILLEYIRANSATGKSSMGMTG